MFGILLLSYLAALGVGLLLWCVCGVLLYPLRCEMTIVLRAFGNAANLERSVRTLRWLRGIGLICGQLRILDCGLDAAGRELARSLACEPGVVFETKE